MSNLNTELISALLKNESIDEVFRSHLENAMNNLLKIELTQFLGYEVYTKYLTQSIFLFCIAPNKVKISLIYASDKLQICRAMKKFR